MQLKSIHIKNFKSFVGGHDFDFTAHSGVIMVTGENQVEPALGANGVGKSTLFDAVCWCLYGKTLQGSSAGYVEARAGDGETSVSLTFESGDTICRKRPKTLLINDAPVAQEDVETLVGMDEDIFRNCIVFGQGNKQFLDFSPTERLQFFTKILSIDLWTRASDNAKQKYKKLLGESEIITVKIDNANAAITDSKARLVQHHEQFDNENKARLRKLDELNLSIEENAIRVINFGKSVDEQKKDLTLANERIDETKRAAAAQNNAVDELHAQQRTISVAHSTLSSQCTAVQTEINRLRKDYLEHKAQIDDTNKKIESANVRQLELLKAKTELLPQREAHQASNQELGDALAKATAKRDELQIEHDGLASKKFFTCEWCGKDIDNTKKTRHHKNGV